MSSSKIIITGGSGFIGTNLIGFYLEKGWQVLNFDIAPPRNPAQQEHWRQVNLLDRERLIDETQAFEPDYFLNFGARTDLDEQVNLAGYAANIDGVLHVIDAVRATPSIERVIFASSQLVCKLGYQPKNDHDYLPSTLYGQSKVLTEKVIRSAQHIGVSWVIMRPTSLWGPWFDIPYKNFFTTIQRGFYLHAAGVRTLKQWGYVGNSVHQIDQLLQASPDDVHRKTFYLADYEPVELRQFADKVQAALGARPIWSVPKRLLTSTAALGDLLQKLGWKNPPLTRFRYSNIVTDEVQDLSPLEAVVGALPYTLDQGIDRTVTWLAAQGEV